VDCSPGDPFFNPSAGAQSESRIPSVGEQCLLLNYGGGESGAQSVALFGLNSERFRRRQRYDADAPRLCRRH
jgi:phage baseplate assembly protein gpV